MQTYEIAPNETMETLVESLSRAAELDKDITLVIPAGVNPFADADSVNELASIMRSHDARLQVRAADPEIVGLFQSVGIKADPIEAEATTVPAQPPPAAQQQRGGFWAKVKGYMAPPVAASQPAAEASSRPAPPPPASSPDPAPTPPSDEPSADEGLTGLDATMPASLRDAPQTPPPAGDRVVSHVPTSSLDVTLPSWHGDAPPAPTMSAEPGMRPEFAPVPPAAPPPDGFNMSTLSGPEQTPASIGQAVSAAGLDARTRSLLLFGMALIRVAPQEAAGAATAARHAGCSTDELRLVVEMAHALGGGPSRYLGQKILAAAPDEPR